MNFKPGSRWRSAVCSTEVVIVRTPRTVVGLSCGGYSMVPFGTEGFTPPDLSSFDSVGTHLGKRYEDLTTGLEVLCSKGGAGSLSVDGRAMALKETKALPASD
jgi:hypothetical protein